MAEVLTADGASETEPPRTTSSPLVAQLEKCSSASPDSLGPLPGAPEPGPGVKVGGGGEKRVSRIPGLKEPVLRGLCRPESGSSGWGGLTFSWWHVCLIVMVTAVRNTGSFQHPLKEKLLGGSMMMMMKVLLQSQQPELSLRADGYCGSFSSVERGGGVMLESFIRRTADPPHSQTRYLHQSTCSQNPQNHRAL